MHSPTVSPELLQPFTPFQALAQELLPLTLEGDDGSHDVAHLHRVWKNSRQISQDEGGDQQILCAAVLLHDCVAVEKNSPQRHLASRMAAEKASIALASLGWSVGDISKTAHAIEAHSFSAAIPPQTLEAKILQDADRLDAIGMIGVARCFYIGGRMRSALYDAADPLAQQRQYDDKRFTLDHFETKLFKLQEGFQTEAGRRMAALRTQRMRRFLSELLEEV
ncbi:MULTISPECIES: HD domain-containing protein [Serratia]|uniref:HD domain-containing protein n=1 Tax=Serratia TaxID=613 RepID=UPI0003AEDDC3|nr:MULTISPECIES: HD domain-containing protein [Serratia]ERK15754.1 metal-dependent phosphohydrolase [Serratia fonticola AU-AP2C]ALX94984.1 phosphohydrolase [Serratia fonticola]MBP1015666.1 HD domain-containing protein [Serratia fonticola]MBP1034668.1 HD domain-containing protein [Serratia fonticola]UAN60061.1 HD domain-containing protein [Serratia sp. JSRIV004]